MRIAVCDDEKNIAKLFSQKIKDVAANSEISIFTEGKTLIDSEAEWDVVFLDISMEPLDGFQVAGKLKKKRPECIISFITTHSELAVDGYDYQPFRYILKSAPEPVIERKISETINEYYRRHRFFNISYKGVYRTVMIKDIRWIEIDGHCMKLNLEDGEAQWNKSLSEMEGELESYGLVRCHRSFVVALRQIKAFTLSSVQLKNGKDIPVGRAYRKHLIQKFESFTLSQ